MQVLKPDFNSIQNKLLSDEACVLTLGNFDGVHTGHRRLITDTVKSAKKRKLAAVAVTFDPHPIKILAPVNHAGLLMTLPQKLDIFEKLEVNLVWVIPFSREFSELVPDIFLNGLGRAINPLELHVGRAFRFGRDRAGDIKYLSAWGKTFGCTVHAHAYKMPDGGVLSSSRIRQVLMEGDVALASDLLGMPYTLTGIVVEGERRGRQLGFPTANIMWEQELLPAPGVYVTAVHCPTHFTELALGLTNVGLKPTFGDSNITVETYLPDRNLNLYGARVELRFLSRIRGEEKLDGPESLKTKIEEDVQHGIKWWKSNCCAAGVKKT